jgi:hypothetical protein
VPSAPAHNRLLAQAAKEVLPPLGLRRKGRSRIWLDDHGWWLGVVEFQPSSWRRGTYLNVGAMWLWHPEREHVYFSLSHRIEGFSEYESDEQFLPEARRIAMRAAEEVERLRGRIRDFLDVADALAADAEARGSWSAWDATVALGLAGETERASAMFRRALATEDDRDWWVAACERLARLAELMVGEPQAFRDEVNGWIARYREALRLPAAPPI